mgnify:FL=1
MKLPLTTSQLNPSYWIPDYRVKSFSDLPPEELSSRGIEAVVFDVDQTLCAHHASSLHPSIKEALEAYVGVFSASRIGIMSNIESNQRRKELERMFPDFYITRSKHKKPGPEPYREIEAAFGLPPS